MEFTGKAGDGRIHDEFGLFGGSGEVTLAYSDLAEGMGWFQGNPSTLGRLAPGRQEKNPECPLRGHRHDDFDGCRERCGRLPGAGRLAIGHGGSSEDQESRGWPKRELAEKERAAPAAD
ncbi:hypothetical protein OIU91_27445 [Streptomyces sp. NBC_01456]|uniref:hypothetical protein n=1 Tax=unclassified Streptomyces TaxID=2593676 RepID=UPI002E32777B|nr:MULTISPECIES: hypothetical protein [unclassified Streptomyces]